MVVSLKGTIVPQASQIDSGCFIPKLQYLVYPIFYSHIATLFSGMEMLHKEMSNYDILCIILVYVQYNQFHKLI